MTVDTEIATGMAVVGTAVEVVRVVGGTAALPSADHLTTAVEGGEVVVGVVVAAAMVAAVVGGEPAAGLGLDQLGGHTVFPATTPQEVGTVTIEVAHSTSPPTTVIGSPTNPLATVARRWPSPTAPVRGPNLRSVTVTGMVAVAVAVAGAVAAIHNPHRHPATAQPPHLLCDKVDSRLTNTQVDAAVVVAPAFAISPKAVEARAVEAKAMEVVVVGQPHTTQSTTTAGGTATLLTNTATREQRHPYRPFLSLSLSLVTRLV